MSAGEQERTGKRFEALFVPTDDRPTIRRRFGAPGAQTFIDGATKEKRAAYLARHGAPAAGEDWSDSGRGSPGWLSRWILWGPSPDIRKNVKRLGGAFVAH